MPKIHLLVSEIINNKTWKYMILYIFWLIVYFIADNDVGYIYKYTPFTCITRIVSKISLVIFGYEYCKEYDIAMWYQN